MHFILPCSSRFSISLYSHFQKQNGSGFDSSRSEPNLYDMLSLSTPAPNPKDPSRILHYLYLGDRNNAKSLSTLLRHDIKYIINCTPSKTIAKTVGCPCYYEKDPRFKYLRIPIFDDGGEDLSVYFKSVYDFIENNKHSGNILVHCRQGVSRSSSFVIGYLMRKCDFTMDEAVGYMKGIRPIIQPNAMFLSQLRIYEESLTLKKRACDTNKQHLPLNVAVDGPIEEPQVKRSRTSEQ